MESQLISDLKAELDASRRQNEHICMEFGVYRKATQVKLSELRQHKRMLGREVIALREKLGASGGNEKTAAAQDEKESCRHPSPNDNDATPLKSIEEQTRAQDKHVHEQPPQFGQDPKLLECVNDGEGESPFLESEISAAINSSDSAIAASISSYDSEIAAPVSSYGGGPTAPSATASATIDWSHRHDPTWSPLALDGQNGERQSSLKGSNPKSKMTSRQFSSKERVLRQRMLLLRHASRCSAPDGTCAYSKHCADVRRALKHITEDGCGDPTCGVKHCLTSRYVLSHYRRRKMDRLPGIDDCGITEGPPRKKKKESRNNSI